MRQIIIERLKVLKACGLLQPPILDVGGATAQYRKENKDWDLKRDLFGPDLTVLDIQAGDGVDIVANAEYMDVVKNESFQTVLCLETLEHVENDGAVMDEIFRILKIGGRAYVCAPSMFPYHADMCGGYKCEDYRRYVPEFGTYESMFPIGYGSDFSNVSLRHLMRRFWPLEFCGYQPDPERLGDLFVEAMGVKRCAY